MILMKQRKHLLFILMSLKSMRKIFVGYRQAQEDSHSVLLEIMMVGKIIACIYQRIMISQCKAFVVMGKF